MLAEISENDLCIEFAINIYLFHHNIDAKKKLKNLM